MKTNVKSFLGRIFLLALLLRLIPVLLSADMGIGLDDMFQYDMLARSIVSGNGYRWYAQEDLYLIQPFLHIDISAGNYEPRGVLTSFRPPLYPAFLALIYLFAGVTARRFFIARLVQAFISAALVPLTYLLARRMLQKSFDPDDPNLEKSARLAAWLITLYPMLVIYPLSLATENLFFLLVLVTILVLIKAADGSSMDKHPGPAGDRNHRVAGSLWNGRWYILGGVLLGLTSLTRSVALAFAGLVILWIWFALREKKLAVLTLAAFVLTVSPWIIRNSMLYHKPTGIETALGYDLYVSYHPESSGTFIFPQSLDLMTILDDAERDKVGIDLATGFILDQPERVPYLMLRRLGYFFGLERRALTYFYSNDFFGFIPKTLLLLAAGVLLIPFIVISTSAMLGAALMRWDRRTLLIGIFFFGYIAPHIVIIAEDRFHLVLLPFMAVLAAGCWQMGRKRLAQQIKTRVGRLTFSAAVLAILLLIVNWSIELWLDADKLRLLFGPWGNQTHFPY